MGNAEEKITLRDLIDRTRDFIKYLIEKVWRIALGSLAVTLILIGYNFLKKPVFSAKTTFVLESDSGGGLGQLSSLASVAGLSLGGLTQDNSLFQIDNIQELYRSRSMIEKALLSPTSAKDHNLLISLYAVEADLIRNWKEKLSEDDLRFSKQRNDFSRAQDSVLMVLTEQIREKHLSVSKPSRNLTILDVTINHQNELFAKEFDEAIVKNVNDFFAETKTKKIRSNIEILQKQADSVRWVLDSKLLELAELTEKRPNANPLLVTSQVPAQKLTIDIQASSAVYTEMVKNLEVTRLSLRNKMPLIQIIDRPIFPLEDNIWTLLKVIVIGFFSGAFIMLLFFSLRYFYRLALTEEDYSE